MKNVLAILMATAMLVSTVPAFACGGDKSSDETTTTSTTDATKDAHAKACENPDCACDKGEKAKKEKKENAS